MLLTDPFLQLPTPSSVQVVWLTEFAGRRHVVLVGEAVARLEPADVLALLRDAEVLSGDCLESVCAIPAGSHRLSRTREDRASRVTGQTYTEVTPRPVWRHEAAVDGLRSGERLPYRVVSVDEQGATVLSDTFSLAPLPGPGTPIRVLLTSDHQLKPMTPANLQMVEATVGRVDAVFLAGDLVNTPDRASEWFDDAHGTAFFPALQGSALGAITHEGTTTVYRGGAIIQHAPLYTAIGNHEVMGRAEGGDLDRQLGATTPVRVAERAYERAGEVDPTGDPEVRRQWVADHSFNLDTYLELFTLPESDSGGEAYYATTIGNVRLVSLFAARAWRPKRTTEDEASAFREPTSAFENELEQGWGQHIFEPIAEGSAQYEWLRGELASPAFRTARYRVVMFHHPIHTLGENVSPPFTDPVRVVERDAEGRVGFVRYDYPQVDDYLLRDIEPLLAEAGVDLVLYGHSHIWNRFESLDGVHFLETSNVGNSYGAFLEGGAGRPVPPPPWSGEDYVAGGDPGALEPVVPNVAPLLGEDGQPLPCVASNEVTVFSLLDTADGTVTSYAYDTRAPGSAAVVLDRFTLDRETSGVLSGAEE